MELQFYSTEKENAMNNIFISTNSDISPSVCICDDAGIHYPCSKCGKYHDDELDALTCCLEN